MKYNTKKEGHILFDKYHLNPLSKVQQPCITLECEILAALIEPLSTNENAMMQLENVILRQMQDKIILL